jgi:hypothetical protein
MILAARSALSLIFLNMRHGAYREVASRLGRQDSNLGSWIQSPLPYRLATPEWMQVSASTALAAREHHEVYHTARHLSCLMAGSLSERRIVG